MTPVKRSNRSKIRNVALKWTSIFISSATTYALVYLYVDKFGIWPQGKLIEFLSDTWTWAGASPLAMLIVGIALKEYLGWFLKKRVQDSENS